MPLSRAQLASSLRRGDIRILSVRWLLEARPTRVLRRQEMEVMHAASSTLLRSYL